MEADFAQEPSKVHWARADARIAKTLSRAGHADHGDDERAANQAHASMYSFFKAKMPPKADECEDSTTWHKNGDPAKDCAWVSEWSPRCSVKGADKSLASEHCTCACQ